MASFRSILKAVLFIMACGIGSTAYPWFTSPSSLSPENDLKFPTELQEFSGYPGSNSIYDRARSRTVVRDVKKVEEKLTTNEQGVVTVVSTEVMDTVIEEIPIKYASEKAPAVILLHACGGITGRTIVDLGRWTRFLTENGFVVLVMNHLSKRGEKTNCHGKSRPVNVDRLAKDVFDATEALSKIPTVDSQRIFTLGFSMGAITGAYVSDIADRSEFKDIKKPRGVVGLYGGCAWSGSGESYLNGDGSIPVLWLMGGADTETAPQPCISGAKTMKERLPPSDWHIYDGMTHCWDCQGLNGYTQVTPGGYKHTYIYNEAATRDSERRILEFYGKIN